MGKRSKKQKQQREDFARQAMTDFMRILLPEIEPSLKANKVPVTRDTKLAFIVGVEVSVRLNVELFDQWIMDLGYDPALLAPLKANRKISESGI